MDSFAQIWTIYPQAYRRRQLRISNWVNRQYGCRQGPLICASIRVVVTNFANWCDLSSEFDIGKIDLLTAGVSQELPCAQLDGRGPAEMLIIVDLELISYCCSPAIANQL
jgi:hypothetical protein